MKAFCDACFRDVEPTPAACCPACGADLSEDKKRREHEAARAVEEGDEGISLLERGGIAAAVLGGLLATPFLKPTLNYWADHYLFEDPNAHPEDARSGIVIAALLMAAAGGVAWAIGRYRRLRVR